VREDDDPRDDRGPSRRRRRTIEISGLNWRQNAPEIARAIGVAAAGDEPLQQDHAARGARPLRQLLPEEDRHCELLDLVQLKDKADSYHVTLSGGQGPAPRARTRARERPGGDLPRRAGRPASTRRAAGRSGGRPEDEGRGPDDDAHDALHGRGRGALRPAPRSSITGRSCASGRPRS